MRKLFLWFLLVQSILSYSQDTTEVRDLGKYKFSAISFFSDANKYEYTSDDINLMYDLVKEQIEAGFAFDSLLPTSYENNSVSFYGLSAIFTRSETRSIEIGLSFSSQENRRKLSVYDRYVRADTFPGADHIIYMDTAYRRFQHSYEEITSVNLNFRKTHRSNPEKSFIVYGGFGLSFGFSVVSRIVNYSTQYSYLKYNIDNRDYYNFSDVYNYSQNPEIIFEPKKSIFTRLYVPFGANLAFSTEDNFFKKLHLDIRSCFGFEHQQVLGNSGYVRSFYAFGLGLRYTI